MSRYSKEDILRIVAEEDVEFVRLQFTDAFGILKNVAITSSQLKRALDNKIMFDGASIDGFVRIEESDMYLYPDLDSFTIFPWRPQQGKVARLICDVCKPEAIPSTSDRNVNFSFLHRMNRAGLQPTLMSRRDILTLDLTITVRMQDETWC